MDRRKLFGEERAARGPRGLAHLEVKENDKTAIHGPDLRRLWRWLALLQEQGTVRSPAGKFILVVLDTKDEILVSGTKTVDGFRFFTCTRCPAATTEHGNSKMLGAWPPPAGWSMMAAPEAAKPMRLRHYNILALVCKNCVP